MCSQLPRSPAAQASQTGSMPRVTQPSTGLECRALAVAVAVDQVGDDLVAGHERERHDRLEVARAVPVDGGEVGAADAGEAGLEAHPVGAGSVGRVDVGRAPAGRPWRPAGDQPTGDMRGGVLGQVALEDAAPSSEAFDACAG